MGGLGGLHEKSQIYESKPLIQTLQNLLNVIYVTSRITTISPVASHTCTTLTQMSISRLPNSSLLTPLSSDFVLIPAIYPTTLQFF